MSSMKTPISDEHHEAYGAMIHVGLTEQRTNRQRNQKKALDFAIKALKAIQEDAYTGASFYIDDYWYSDIQLVLDHLKEMCDE